MKSMKRKFLILVSLIVAIACLCGIAGCAKSKTFEKAGMHITLTSSFHEKDLLSQTAYYESSDAIVTALKEEFTLQAGMSDYSLSQYTNLVLNNNRLSSVVSEREGSYYLYFTYEKSLSGKDFFYLATTHKTNDAFWLIQFACASSDKDKMTETFLKYADSIVFD